MQRLRLYSWIDLPRAWGEARASGVFRSQPEDFVVDEIPVCEPKGSGEHLWIKVRKTGQNTDWVAKKLAKRAGIRPRDVGYAGLKDRHAITTQWFSMHLPGKTDPDLADSGEGIEITQAVRHTRKLRRGALKGNRFRLRLNDVCGDRTAIESRLQQVRSHGFPNYFGEQRFGKNGGNLDKAEAMFAGNVKHVPRSKRSLYLSAARSFLFNRVLATRIEQANWNRVVQGDVLQLDGRSACFALTAPDNETLERLARMEVHPTGPLWGQGVSMATGDCLALELECLDPCHIYRAGLEDATLRQERRALRVGAGALDWEWIDYSTLELRFRLPAGSYATALLHELGLFEPGGQATC